MRRSTILARVRDLGHRARQLQLLPLRMAARAVGRRARREGKTLLAHLPSFLPENRAGSEVSIAQTLASFRDRGWSVTVVVDAPGRSGDYEGLHVVRQPSAKQLLNLYRSCDVVVTQLVSRNRAMRWATLAGRPLVLFLRMGGIDPSTMLGRPNLVVFNAAWLRSRSKWVGSSIVLRPMIDPSLYRTKPGDAITLVNVTEQKGSSVLLELARRCPDLSFLGVRGGWGQQLESSDLPNLRLIGPVDDMRDVYHQTRVLLMPSTKEAFGRVGVEAACSGIPTIAAPLPGIREALGDAALYADRDDLAAWERHVRSLQELHTHERLSRTAQQRAELWAQSTELDDLIDRVATLATPDPPE